MDFNEGNRILHQIPSEVLMDKCWRTLKDLVLGLKASGKLNKTYITGLMNSECEWIEWVNEEGRKGVSKNCIWVRRREMDGGSVWVRKARKLVHKYKTSYVTKWMRKGENSEWVRQRVNMEVTVSLYHFHWYSNVTSPNSSFCHSKQAKTVSVLAS